MTATRDQSWLVKPDFGNYSQRVSRKVVATTSEVVHKPCRTNKYLLSIKPAQILNFKFQGLLWIFHVCIFKYQDSKALLYLLRRNKTEVELVRNNVP